MLRSPRPAEREDIRRWRNHPQVRQVSFTGHEISAAEHAQWWTRVSGDPTCRLLIYEESEIPSGVVIFEQIRTEPSGVRSASWGFYLDLVGLAERGTGLSAWLGVQRAALDHAFGPLNLDVLTAEVLEDNTVVRRTNRRFGFAEGEPTERMVDGRSVRYRPISLRRDQRRSSTGKGNSR